VAILNHVEGETFAIIWLGFNAAQRLRESFVQSPLPDQESHLNLSPADGQPEGEIGGREVDPISPEATGKERR
jgi:hypothetical protein